MADAAEHEFDRREHHLFESAGVAKISRNAINSASRSRPKNPATGHTPSTTKGMLAAAAARQHSVMTMRMPPGPSDRCGWITAAKTGRSKRCAGSGKTLPLSIGPI
jgi:hypothetical protein